MMAPFFSFLFRGITRIIICCATVYLIVSLENCTPSSKNQEPQESDPELFVLWKHLDKDPHFLDSLTDKQINDLLPNLKKIELIGIKASAGIGQAEHDDLYRQKNFMINAGTTTVPAIDIQINLYDLIKYFDNTPAMDYHGGLRFYPALYNDGSTNKIATIVARSNKEDLPTIEDKYYLLKDSYPQGSFPGIVPPIYLLPGQAVPMIQAYFAYVHMYDATKNQVPNDTFRISRYYSWAELIHLTADNLIDINDDIKTKATNLKIEVGYVNQRIATDFYALYYLALGGLDLIDLKGYTTMISIVGQVDPISVGNPHDYYHRFMEIGKPCPPRCGKIRFNALGQITYNP